MAKYLCLDCGTEGITREPPTYSCHACEAKRIAELESTGLNKELAVKQARDEWGAVITKANERRQEILALYVDKDDYTKKMVQGHLDDMLLYSPRFLSLSDAEQEKELREEELGLGLTILPP
jgi:hypothetical protein